MQSKITPGPWVEFEILDAKPFAKILIGHESKTKSGPQFCELIASHVTDEAKQELIANARAIAAVPDLIAAVQVAIVRLKEVQYQIASHKQIEYLEQVLAKAGVK